MIAFMDCTQPIFSLTAGETCSSSSTSCNQNQKKKI
jgi:hypothetical protein